MARRKGPTAELAVQNEAFNRWRILLRHQKFQKGLNRLRSQYGTWVKGSPITQYIYEFASPDLDEFGTEIPTEIKCKVRRKDVDLLNECDPNDPMVGMPEGAWHTFNAKWGIHLPKVALSEALPDLGQNTIEQWTPISSKEPAIVPFPLRAAHSRKNWLRLEINLSYPRDILIERIEKQLAQVMSQSRKARRRWDKFDYYLQVYDLGLKNETFASIACALKKSVSTVKSAWLSIGRTISSFDPTGLKRSHPPRLHAYRTKKQTVLQSFDDKNHVSQCAHCTKAKTADDMCPQAKLYVNQETRGQRELAVADVEKIMAARLNSRTGRRKPALDRDPDSLEIRPLKQFRFSEK